MATINQVEELAVVRGSNSVSHRTHDTFPSYNIPHNFLLSLAAAAAALAAIMISSWQAEPFPSQCHQSVPAAAREIERHK